MKWAQLVRGAGRVAPASVSNVSQSARIYNLDLNYAEGVRTMTFYGEVTSSSRPGFRYTVAVSFLNVDRTDGLTEEEILQGYQPKPSLADNDIQIRCSCLAYRFRNDQANRSHGAGYGRGFGNYHRRTDRKPNNPQNLASTCKHVIEFIEYLQSTGFVL